MDTVIMLINDNRTWVMPLVFSGVLARLAWEAWGMARAARQTGQGG